MLTISIEDAHLMTVYMATEEDGSTFLFRNTAIYSTDHTKVTGR